MTETLLRSRRLCSVGRVIKFLAIGCMCCFAGGVAPTVHNIAQPGVAAARAMLTIQSELKGLVTTHGIAETGFGGNSLMIDYVDRSKRNYNHFDTAFSFNDRTRSARQCIPAGFRYRLWININHTRPSFDLLGTGSRQSMEWSTTQGFSSGCFHDGVNCL